MAWTRNAVFPICGLAMILACSSRSKGKGAPDTGDPATGTVVCFTGSDASYFFCLCVPQADAQGIDPPCPASGPAQSSCGCGGEGGDDVADDGGSLGDDGGPGGQTESPQSPGGPAAAPFLGTWTLVGTEQYVCAAETSDSLPESATMTLRPGPGSTDGGEVDLLFDGGIGRSLAMSIARGVARLTSAPQTCGVAGKPLDRVFTSVELTPATQFPGWLRLEETFTDQSGCAFLVQGYLLP